MAEEIAGLIRPRGHVVGGVADDSEVRSDLLGVFECGATDNEAFVEPKEIEGFLTEFIKDLAVDVGEVGRANAEEFASGASPKTVIGAKHFRGSEVNSSEVVPELAECVEALDAGAAWAELTDVEDAQGWIKFRRG
jgi:hypothetical protein